MRPKVGLRPVTPQNADGMRTEPPVSDPSEKTQSPAACAEVEPPLEPPGIRERSHGLWMAPKCGLLLVIPYASSWSPVLPRRMAPASYSGRNSRKIFDPAVVATPLV